MSTVKNLCLILMLIMLILTGIYGFVPYLSPTLSVRLNSLYQYATGAETSRLLFCLLIILLPLFYLLVSVRQWSYRRGYVIRAKGGDSMISEGAILKCLSSAIRTIPSVKSVRPRIKNVHAGLAVRIDTLIKVEQYVPQIYERIRQRARSTLIGVLGIDRIARIDVNIDKVRLPHPPLAEHIERGKKPLPPKPAIKPAPSQPVAKPVIASFPPKPAVKPALNKPAGKPAPSQYPGFSKIKPSPDAPVKPILKPPTEGQTSPRINPPKQGE